LHTAFLKFHNAVMDVIPGPVEPPSGGYASCVYSRPGGGDTLYHRALKQVRFHYQWIVLHEFLPNVIDATVLQDVLDNGRRFYTFEDNKPYMPVEFSVAAYRFGHSMIRETYDWNRAFNNAGPPALAPATMRLLFAFTGKGGFRPPNTHLNLPSNWIADWRRIFEFDRPDLVNPTRKLDTTTSPQMHDLPRPSVAAEPPVSLPARNLLRGGRVGLPTGQAVAEAMQVTALTAAQLTDSAHADIVREFGFETSTPLWYYVLKEAEVSGGNRLGAVGSRILAEVFVGLLEGSPHSFLSQEPTWTPTLGPTPGSFTVADMIAFPGTNNINPLGE